MCILAEMGIECIQFHMFVIYSFSQTTMDLCGKNMHNMHKCIGNLTTKWDKMSSKNTEIWANRCFYMILLAGGGIWQHPHKIKSVRDICPIKLSLRLDGNIYTGFKLYCPHLHSHSFFQICNLGYFENFAKKELRGILRFPVWLACTRVSLRNVFL